MFESQSNVALKIEVFGPLRVVDNAGIDYTPKAIRSRALLALLSLGDRQPRARPWLQSVLWPDRGEEQARVSLRQCLAEIRKSFGPHKECLVADRRSVQLDSSRVGCNPEAQLQSLQMARSTTPDLLEDLTPLRSDAFRRWMQNQRELLSPSTLRSPITDSPQSQYCSLTILHDHAEGDHHGKLLAQHLADTIARGLMESTGVSVRNNLPGPSELCLRLQAMGNSDSALVHLSLASQTAEVKLWSQTTQVPMLMGQAFSSAKTSRLINQTIDMVQHHLFNSKEATAENKAIALGMRATWNMFHLSEESLHKSLNLFDSALERQRLAILLAWKAYCFTYFIGERVNCDGEALVDEARALVEQAIEMDPYNSQVLSLASYVYSFILNNPVTGQEFAARGYELNPSNPFALSALSQAHIYAGDYERAYSYSVLACNLAGSGRYRFMLDSQSCMAATLTGRYEHAMRMCNIARAEKSSYSPPLRYKFVLQLTAGHFTDAIDSWSALKLIEPDISLNLMRDPSYPSSGIRLSGLINKRFQDFE